MEQMAEMIGNIIAERIAQEHARFIIAATFVKLTAVSTIAELFAELIAEMAGERTATIRKACSKAGLTSACALKTIGGKSKIKTAKAWEASKRTTGFTGAFQDASLELFAMGRPGFGKVNPKKAAGLRKLCQRCAVRVDRTSSKNSASSRIRVGELKWVFSGGRI